MGDRLRKAREDAGLSQSQLASVIGISRNTVGNAELGERQPLLVTVKAWAAATGVPVEWLQFGHINPDPPSRSRRRGQGVKRTATELMQKRYDVHRPNDRQLVKVAA